MSESGEDHSAVLAALRAEHTHICAWNIDGFGLIVCRRMRKFEQHAAAKAGHTAQKLNEASGDTQAMTKVNETVVTSCCVYPQDKKLLEDLFNDWPDFSGMAAVAIFELGKAGITDLGKA
jgi:hypothetical protein